MLNVISTCSSSGNPERRWLDSGAMLPTRWLHNLQALFVKKKQHFDENA
jgi:hypothetical protein